MVYERKTLKMMLRFGALCDDNHREYSPTSIVKDEIHADITGRGRGAAPCPAHAV
ncbi:hypothetical protein KSD_52070 [Ktedonobacter sp. SOSP1-85]|nr:hypothetical protein KSD_52070 [Ktedonobacter sp. SOSP1-85]